MPASNQSDARQSFLCLCMPWYHYDDALVMYSKPRGASMSERASERARFVVLRRDLESA